MKHSKFIHWLVLTAVLIFSFASTVQARPKGPTIIDAAIQINSEGPFTGQFGTLIAAVEASDPIVLNTLSGNGQFTVFAPTDDAFLQLSLTPENITTLSKSELTDILLYHVAPGRTGFNKRVRSKENSDDQSWIFVPG